MNLKQIREQFEEAHGEAYGHIGGGITPQDVDPWKNKNGIYRNRSVQDRWEGYQWAYQDQTVLVVESTNGRYAQLASVLAEALAHQIDLSEKRKDFGEFYLMGKHALEKYVAHDAQA